MLRWGLIPAWAKEPNIGYTLINARAETVASKPAFRTAFRARRCLIPADGFYEWAKQGKTKQPWLIRREGGAAFAFAGLWERWIVPRGMDRKGWLTGAEPGAAIETCTILTTVANDAVAPIHHRMPMILSPEEFGPWLAGEAVSLGPHPSETMTLYPVGTLVNRPASDDPRCIEPVALP